MNIRNISRTVRAAIAMMLLGTAFTATGAAVNSGDATLSALEIKVDGHNLVNFDRNTTSYSIEIDDTSLMTLSAAPTASDATVTITVNGREYDNHSLAYSRRR